MDVPAAIELRGFLLRQQVQSARQPLQVCASGESVPGTKLTLPTITRMSAFGGKADMAEEACRRPLLTPSRRWMTALASVSTTMAGYSPQATVHLIVGSAGRMRQYGRSRTLRLKCTAKIAMKMLTAVQHGRHGITGWPPRARPLRTSRYNVHVRAPILRLLRVFGRRHQQRRAAQSLDQDGVCRHSLTGERRANARGPCHR